MPTLTREQLYALVWAEPIQKIAPRYGLSDRGFGKLCARYNIPVPPRGHWAKKAAGKRVKQPPLPKEENPYQQKIRLGEPMTTETPLTPDPPHPLIAFEQDPANRIVLPPDLQLTHPLTVKTQKLLNRGKRDAAGLVASPSGGLHVHTSRPLHERALRIMQALLEAFEKRDFTVTSGQEGLRVTVLDEPIAFGIEEATKRVPHVTTFTEQKLIDRGAGWQVPKHDSVPSGTLTLAITNVGHVRQRWTETPTRTLEELLNRFLIGLVRASLGLKKQREDAERRETERQEEERRRAEEARRLAEAELRWREEQGRVERLERLHAMWQRNRGLRELVIAVREVLGPVEAGSELETWLAWAYEYAQRSDPLNRYRERTGGTITLYYYGYDHDRMREEGFKEPDLERYGTEKKKSGVEFTERPPRRTSWESALQVEIAEDVVLPFEWPQESRDYWRTFRVPAEVLNKTLKLPRAAAERAAPE